MLPDISKYQHHLKRFSDIRFVGQVIFVVIVLLITWSGIKVIYTNYQLQQQIGEAQQKNENQKLENQNLQLNNEYYNSPQYLELSARQNFGLAAPGEKELLVPKEVALAHIPDSVKKPPQQQSSSQDDGPFYKRNPQAWLDFFLHRDVAGN